MRYSQRKLTSMSYIMDLNYRYGDNYRYTKHVLSTF